MIFEAELRTARFKRGQRDVETGMTRMARSAKFARGAMRDFERGLHARGLRRTALAAGEAGRAFLVMGRRGKEAITGIVGGLSNMLGMLRRVAMSATLVGGIVAGIGIGSIVKAAEFGHQIEGVAALSDATPEEQKSLRRTIVGIGKETPFSLMDVGKGSEFFARRGFKPEEIERLTGAATKLAIVGRSDFTTAAEALAQIIQQFGIPTERADEIAGKLGQTLKNTALGAEDLFDAMKRLGTMAGAGNLELTEMLSLVGKIAGAMPPSEAGTGLSRIIGFSSALQTKSPKRLEAMGLTPEIAKQVAVFGGKAKSVIDIIEQLTQAFGKADHHFIQAFGQKNVAAVFSVKKELEELGRKGFDELGRKINDHAAFLETYNRFLNTTHARILKVKAGFSALIVTFGDKLIESFGVDSGLDGMVAWLDRIEEVISKMSPEEMQAIGESIGPGLIDAFEKALAFFIKSIPPIALVLGKALFDSISGAVSSIFEDDDVTAYKASISNLSTRELEEKVAYFERLTGVSRDRAGDLDVFNALRGRFGSGTAKQFVGTIDVLDDRGGLDPLITSGIDTILKNANALKGELMRGPIGGAVLDAVDGVKQRERESSGAKTVILDQRQSGVINHYGQSSNTARSRNRRGVAQTRQAEAQR